MNQDYAKIEIVEQKTVCVNIHKHRASADERLYEPVDVTWKMCLDLTHQLAFVSHIKQW